MEATSAAPDTSEIWRWLREIPDPEIPVISVVDLGIIREARWNDGELVVTVTPTYTGCPAANVIMRAVESALHARGIENLRLERQLSPPWTTDWISAAGRRKLKEYGIAPPAGRAGPLACPRCGSVDVVRISEFGSTPCKAQYRCSECLEPFDYFKCI